MSESSIRAPRSVSGQHPAVQAYRKRLDSVETGASAATTELDRKLSEYLHDIKTPVPPPPERPGAP
jgi:hypothetical protein